MGVAVASLLALVPARADAGSTYVHSARSGTFAGGRLTLHGVGSKVKWFTTGKHHRHGVAPVAFAQKRVFLHGMRSTGVLHIAGKRGGEKFAFQLSDPRYSKARRTASYRATRLTKGPSTARGAGVPPRFGPASLSVTPASSGIGSGKGASVGSGDSGNDCVYILEDYARASPYLINQSADKWDTDTWAPYPPSRMNVFDHAFVGTAGGLWRGCHNQTVWFQYTGSPTITIDFSWPWTEGPTTTCTVSNPKAYSCTRDDQGGEVIWKVTSL
jgi:hypothetical protein